MLLSPKKIQSETSATAWLKNIQMIKKHNKGLFIIYWLSRLLYFVNSLIIDSCITNDLFNFSLICHSRLSGVLLKKDSGQAGITRRGHYYASFNNLTVGKNSMSQFIINHVPSKNQRKDFSRLCYLVNLCVWVFPFIILLPLSLFLYPFQDW